MSDVDRDGHDRRHDRSPVRARPSADVLARPVECLAAPADGRHSRRLRSADGRFLESRSRARVDCRAQRPEGARLRVFRFWRIPSGERSTSGSRMPPPFRHAGEGLSAELREQLALAWLPSEHRALKDHADARVRCDDAAVSFSAVKRADVGRGSSSGWSARRARRVPCDSRWRRRSGRWRRRADATPGRWTWSRSWFSPARWSSPW